MSKFLPDIVRISMKHRKAYPVPYADGTGGVHWQASEAFSRGQAAWLTCNAAGDTGRAWFAEMAGRNVVRMTSRDINHELPADRPLGVVAAVRFAMTSYGTKILRAPRNVHEHWVIDTAPNSTYRGKPMVFGARDDGAVYGLRLHDVERESILSISAKAEGLGDNIDALVARRCQQYEEVFAPINSREFIDSVTARVLIQRAIDADARVEGNLWWIHGPAILEEHVKGRTEKEAEQIRLVREQVKGLPKPYELPLEEPRRDPADDLAPPPPPPAPPKSPERIAREEADASFRELEAGLASSKRELVEMAARRLGVSADEAEEKLAAVAKPAPKKAPAAKGAES